jgi:hypothetical protein
MASIYKVYFSLEERGEGVIGEKVKIPYRKKEVSIRNLFQRIFASRKKNKGGENFINCKTGWSKLSSGVVCFESS